MKDTDVLIDFLRTLPPGTELTWTPWAHAERLDDDRWLLPTNIDIHCEVVEDALGWNWVWEVDRSIPDTRTAPPSRDAEDIDETTIYLEPNHGEDHWTDDHVSRALSQWVKSKTSNDIAFRYDPELRTSRMARMVEMTQEVIPNLERECVSSRTNESLGKR